MLQTTTTRPARPRPEPGPRLVARLQAAFDGVESWLARLEAMPADRTAPLSAELVPQIERTLRLTRRALGREIGEAWLTSWRRNAPVSNAEAVIALLKARQALDDVAARYDARFGTISG